MTVAQLEATMPYREFVEWRHFYALDPPLSERIDLVGGIVASVLANVNRAKGQKPYKPSDFMPLLEKPKAKPKQETREEAIVSLMASIRETKKRLDRKKT